MTQPLNDKNPLKTYEKSKTTFLHYCQSNLLLRSYFMLTLAFSHCICLLMHRKLFVLRLEDTKCARGE